MHTRSKAECRSRFTLQAHSTLAKCMSTVPRLCTAVWSRIRLIGQRTLVFGRLVKCSPIPSPHLHERNCKERDEREADEDQKGCSSLGKASTMWNGLLPHGPHKTTPPSMRDNEETVLVGSKVVLVPYRREHVERYHAWMKDPEIREQTASEPLSLEEEYEMQASWHRDSDKLTFIVLAREGPTTEDYGTAEEAMAQAGMAGDVNLFLSERQPDEDDDDVDDGRVSAQRTEESYNGSSQVYDAELEVMIAEPRCRRKGLAREALGLLMYYATTRPGASRQPPSKKLDTEIGDKVEPSALPLPLDAFVAKVGIDNVPSLRMFESMGFHEVHRSTVWREAELRPDPARLDVLRTSIFAPRQVLHWRQ